LKKLDENWDQKYILTFKLWIWVVLWRNKGFKFSRDFGNGGIINDVDILFLFYFIENS